MGCLKLTYHQEPELRISYRKKELTLKNTAVKERSNTLIKNIDLDGLEGVPNEVYQLGYYVEQKVNNALSTANNWINNAANAVGSFLSDDYSGDQSGKTQSLGTQVVSKTGGDFNETKRLEKGGPNVQQTNIDEMPLFSMPGQAKQLGKLPTTVKEVVELIGEANEVAEKINKIVDAVSGPEKTEDFINPQPFRGYPAGSELSDTEFQITQKGDTVITTERKKSSKDTTSVEKFSKETGGKVKEK